MAKLFTIDLNQCSKIKLMYFSLSVMYPEVFWADWYIHEIQKSTAMVHSKIMPPDALKMHSWPCLLLISLQTFSKLLKFTLQNSLPCG